MKYLLFISAFILTACKNRVDIDNIEQREHGLSYIKGTNQLVSGEVVRKFENGRLAELNNYKDGKPIGDWFAYGYKGETVSHGFGIDATKYQPELKSIDLTNSVLSINIEGSFCFATLYLDNKLIFDDSKGMLALSKRIFQDYSAKYKIEDILMFDKEHEYTISKTATIDNKYKIDTIFGKDKKTIFIK